MTRTTAFLMVGRRSSPVPSPHEESSLSLPRFGGHLGRGGHDGEGGSERVREVGQGTTRGYIVDAERAFSFACQRNRGRFTPSRPQPTALSPKERSGWGWGPISPSTHRPLAQRTQRMGLGPHLALNPPPSRPKNAADGVGAPSRQKNQWSRRELNPRPQGFQSALIHVRSRSTLATGFADSATT